MNFKLVLGQFMEIICLHNNYLDAIITFLFSNFQFFFSLGAILKNLQKITNDFRYKIHFYFDGEGGHFGSSPQVLPAYATPLLGTIIVLFDDKKLLL